MATFCEACLQNHEHCSCPKTEEETRITYVNEILEDTLKKILENTSRTEPYSKRYWDGYILRDYATLLLQDPTRTINLMNTVSA